MTDEAEKFFGRTDAHIQLSNEQMQEADMAKVSASMLYASARFNAWTSAYGSQTVDNMAASKQEIIDYFCEQYRQMLTENIEDYLANYDFYLNMNHANQVKH